MEFYSLIWCECHAKALQTFDVVSVPHQTQTQSPQSKTNWNFPIFFLTSMRCDAMPQLYVVQCTYYNYYIVHILNYYWYCVSFVTNFFFFHFDIRYSYPSCSGARAPGLAADMHFRDNVIAFIGPACAFALEPVARLAAYWNTPIITGMGDQVTI